MAINPYGNKCIDCKVSRFLLFRHSSCLLTSPFECWTDQVASCAAKQWPALPKVCIQEGLLRYLWSSGAEHEP
jgi:hypothetical protein